MPEWHQFAPMPGHVEESETAKTLQLNATTSPRFIVLFVNSTAWNNKIALFSFAGS